MNVKIPIHNCSLETRRQGVATWNVPRLVQTEVLQFISDLAVGKVNRGRRISESRQTKYLDVLRPPLEFWNKPTETITDADVEAFERALTSDRIQSRVKERPYSAATKSDIRKALKVYFRWRLGPTEAMRLVGWLDTHDPVKTPEFLKEAEVELLYKNCRTAEQRYVIAVLFDSGARAEEFLNIRFEDIQLPEGKDAFVKLTLKKEYSKTEGRTISLYWRNSLEAVRDFLKDRIAHWIRPSDPLSTLTYDAIRMFLTRLGAKTLDKPVHPHLLRHSSATYYASKMNRQELCYRYGWKFSSNMPDVYISRAGMVHEQLDQKFTNVEFGGLKDELAAVRQENAIKEERIKKLEHVIGVLETNIPAIATILSAEPSVAQIEAAIARRRRQAA